MNSRPRRTTIKDVAEAAGVSPTTVSFILNDTPNTSIGDEAKARVRSAVAELGYRPNAMAQGLRRSRSNTLGFITDQVASTPYAGEMIHGAQQAAWAHGKILLLVNTNDNADIETAAVEMMLKQQVEGIVYATWFHRAVAPSANLREVPAVLLDCYSEDWSLPSVVPDEVRGGYDATAYLLRKGHKRVAFLNYARPIPAHGGRLAGYRQALADFDVSFDPLLVETGLNAHEAFAATQRLMSQAQPPTAIFSFNDRMAMGVYDALRKLNCAIPEDVAVVGFDNQEIIAANLYPPLTTFALPHFDMGRWAVEQLMQRLSARTTSANGAAESSEQAKLHCPLVERESA